MIEKQNIIEGDQQQFNTLLLTHFIDASEDASLVVDDALRQKIASMLLKLSNSALATQLVWSDAVATAIIAEGKKHFPDIAPLLQAQLRFDVQLMAALPQFSQLDAALMPSILPLRIYFLASSISNPKFYFSKQPFKQVFELIYQSAMGWEPIYAKHSDAYIALLDELVAQIFLCPLRDRAAMQDVLVQAQDKLSQFNKRFKLLSSRLVATESGLLKAGRVNDEVYRYFSTLLQSQNLPAAVSSFIQANILADIKLYLIEHGLDSPLWGRWQKLLKLLVLFYQDGDVEQSAANKKLMMRLPDEMREMCNVLNIDAQLSEAFCNRIDFDFAMIAAGKPVAELTAVSCTFSFDVQNTPRGQVSEALLSEVSAHQLGQWFIVKETGEVSRVQLSLKLEHFNQLLFTNFVGQKAFTKNFSEFAYMLSAGLAKPLSNKSIIDLALHQVLDALMSGFSALYTQKDSQRKAALLQQKQLQEQEQKRCAAKKARAEALEFKARQDAEQLRIKNEKVIGDLRKEARLSFDTLSLGGWIEVLKDDGSGYFRAKLAVKFNATGRFVFVNQDGVTVIESQRDDLVARVMAKKIRLLDGHDSFAERLDKVLQTICDQ